MLYADSPHRDRRISAIETAVLFATVNTTDDGHSGGSFDEGYARDRI